MIWDESVDGDFPDENSLSNTEFQPVQLVDGTNRYRDAFSFTVPDSASNVTVTVSSFVLRNGNSESSFTGYRNTPLTTTNRNNEFGVSSSNTNLTNTLWSVNSLPPKQYGLVIAESISNGTEYEISITCTGCSPLESVPTLSEWGLLILALLLMTAGTLYLVQPSGVLKDRKAR